MAEQDITTMEQLMTAYKNDHQSLLDLAKYAENANRYEDETEFMKALIEHKKGGNKRTELEDTERNMLSVCYKNVVGNGRAGHRNLQEPEHQTIPYCKEYKAIIEAELKNKCNEILDVITNSLLPEDNDVLIMRGKDPETGQDYINEETKKAAQKKFGDDKKEITVFYLKMCGDYYRYLAEFLDTDVKEKADDYYTQALEVAEGGLDPTHPTRLGLILNASVCKYEILNLPHQATKLAKKGFDEAISKLDSLNDENYKDSTLIMQLLRDNLTIWQTNTDNDDRED